MSLSIAKAARDSQRTRSLGQQQAARARYVNRTSKTTSQRQPHPNISSKGTAAVDLRVQLDEARGAASAGDDDAAARLRDVSPESDDASPLPRIVEVSFADLAVGPKRSKQLSGDFEIVPRSTPVIAMDERDFSGVAGDSASSSEGEDDWELLDMAKEFSQESHSAKSTGSLASWASIVRSKA